MICGQLNECIEDRNEMCRRERQCIQYTDTRSTVKCEEKRKKYHRYPRSRGASHRRYYSRREADIGRCQARQRRVQCRTRHNRYLCPRSHRRVDVPLRGEEEIARVILARRPQKCGAERCGTRASGCFEKTQCEDRAGYPPQIEKNAAKE